MNFPTVTLKVRPDQIPPQYELSLYPDEKTAVARAIEENKMIELEIAEFGFTRCVLSLRVAK